MKKRLTQTAKQKQYIADIKNMFCLEFGWSEEEYCTNEFEKAFLWLKVNNLPEDYSYSKTFWNWWKLTLASICEQSIQDRQMPEILLIHIKLYSNTLKQIKNESIKPITQKTIQLV